MRIAETGENRKPLRRKNLVRLPCQEKMADTEGKVAFQPPTDEEAALYEPDSRTWFECRAMQK